MWLGFGYSFALTRHGKGNDAGAALNVLVRADPGDGPRLDARLAGRDPGTLHHPHVASFLFATSAEGPVFPRFSATL